MTHADFLMPVFVQVALTFFLQLWMARLRVRALREGEVRVKDIALRQPGWPARTTQIANSFHNQLELPILFYVLIVLVLVTGARSSILLVLAWAFVAARLAHAYVHTTSNDLRLRFFIFAAGTMILIAMWILFAARILVA